MKERVKITNQKLFVFLDEHDALEKFIANVDFSWIDKESINSGILPVSEILFHAFSWGCSSERYEYWDDLYTKAKRNESRNH